MADGANSQQPTANKQPMPPTRYRLIVYRPNPFKSGVVPFALAVKPFMRPVVVLPVEAPTSTPEVTRIIRILRGHLDKVNNIDKLPGVFGPDVMWIDMPNGPHLETP